MATILEGQRTAHHSQLKTQNSRIIISNLLQRTGSRQAYPQNLWDVLP